MHSNAATAFSEHDNDSNNDVNMRLVYCLVEFRKACPPSDVAAAQGLPQLWEVALRHVAVSMNWRSCLWVSP